MDLPEEAVTNGALWACILPDLGEKNEGSRAKIRAVRASSGASGEPSGAGGTHEAQGPERRKGPAGEADRPERHEEAVRPASYHLQTIEVVITSFFLCVHGSSATFSLFCFKCQQDISNFLRKSLKCCDPNIFTEVTSKVHQ